MAKTRAKTKTAAATAMETGTGAAAGTTATTAAEGRVLPGGSPDKIVKGALQLEAQGWQVGVTATTVNENTAARGGAYDRRSRSLLITLVDALSNADPELQAELKELAQALGIDPAQAADGLARQQAAWDGFRDAWTIRTAARTGRRVVDGTRRLARGMVEVDAERAMAGMDPAARKQAEDDLRDYRDAVNQDATERTAAARLTREIAAAGQERLGEFRDRRQLLDTLDKLDARADLPWDVLVRAGATLDRLTGPEEQPAATTTDPRSQPRQ